MIYQIQALPIELLYEIQLVAFSHALPRTCRHLYQVYKAAPPSFQAAYILGRIRTQRQKILTKALRYPLCSKDVLDAIFRATESPRLDFSLTDLPKRLFRTLIPRPLWTERDEPLPFLKLLVESGRVNGLNVNAHEGYALTKAVRAGFIPLIRFLLDHGASPHHKGSHAIMAAIRRRDLSLVRMLIECHGSVDQKGGLRRRRLRDRVPINSSMLHAAVRYEAPDIINYFIKDGGCIPDIQTLGMMMR